MGEHGTGSPTHEIHSAVGRWVILRPVLPPDYPVLYTWAADLRELYLWSHDRRVAPYQEFAARVEASLRESQSYLITLATGTPIGFCQAYDLNLVEGWCSFLVYVVRPYRKMPHPAEATIILLDLLFKYFPLRKIYADVFEYNTDSYNILTNHGCFREEARLPNHIWYESRYWSVLKLAVYREDYYEARERMDRILQVQHDYNSLIARQGEAAREMPGAPPLH